MRIKTVGNKKDVVLVAFQNDESSLSIKRGAPIYLKALGTVPGLSAVSAEALAAANQGTFWGFNAMQDAVAVNGYGESQVCGVFEYARVLVTTRAASTDVWASYAAVALYDIMKVNSAASVQAIERSGAGSAGVFPAIAALFSYASSTTNASSLGYSVGDILNSVIEARVFVRAM